LEDIENELEDREVVYKDKNYKLYKADYNVDSGYDKDQILIAPKEPPADATRAQILDYRQKYDDFINNSFNYTKAGDKTPYIYIPSKYFKKVIYKKN